MICETCDRTMNETTIYGLLIGGELHIACSRCKFWREKGQTQLREWQRNKE